MPKRKRNEAPSLLERLEQHQEEIARALKAAKGFERQRLSKRLHEDGITADKKTRLEREVLVLKSIDLHQTARAQLYSSLLKVKSIVASTDLPEQVRTGVAKPDISQEEKAALHNVTSAMCNQDAVKKSVNRAIEAVCEALDLPPPQKAKRLRKGKQDVPDDPLGNHTSVLETKEVAAASHDEEKQEESESEFEGFETDVDEPGPAVGQPDSDEEAEEEAAISKFDELLGSSSDEEGHDDDEDENEQEGGGSDPFAKLRGTEAVNLDDISLPSSGSESDVESLSDASLSPPPQAEKEEKKKKKKKTTTSKTSRSTQSASVVTSARKSTFLPSLMGGYISGSESASDVDVAPAKKRRGQRARQAIAEKKYGDKAKHLQKPAAGARDRGGRASGWDAKRGAVDGEDAAGRRTPWKKGMLNPLVRQTAAARMEAAELRPEPKPRQRDDRGTLHPSWVARKQAKNAQNTVSFSGEKITFD